MAEDGGNYLEDFLTSIEMIPNDVRRDFELIRELDRQATELKEQLSKLEQTYLQRLREGESKAELSNTFIAIEEVRSKSLLTKEIVLYR